MGKRSSKIFFKFKRYYDWYYVGQIQQKKKVPGIIFNIVFTGVSISVDHETPLYIALDNFNGEKRFCLQARYDNFVYFYHNTALPVLNYSICTSNNIKILHGYMSEKSLWDGLKVFFSNFSRTCDKLNVIIKLIFFFDFRKKISKPFILF